MSQCYEMTTLQLSVCSRVPLSLSGIVSTLVNPVEKWDEGWGSV
jgi:hypothetical protein